MNKIQNASFFVAPLGYEVAGSSLLLDFVPFLEPLASLCLKDSYNHFQLQETLDLLIPLLDSYCSVGEYDEKEKEYLAASLLMIVGRQEQIFRLFGEKREEMKTVFLSHKEEIERDNLLAESLRERGVMSLDDLLLSIETGEKSLEDSLKDIQYRLYQMYLREYEAKTLDKTRYGKILLKLLLKIPLDNSDTLPDPSSFLYKTVCDELYAFQELALPKRLKNDDVLKSDDADLLREYMEKLDVQIAELLGEGAELHWHVDNVDYHKSYSTDEVADPDFLKKKEYLKNGSNQLILRMSERALGRDANGYLPLDYRRKQLLFSLILSGFQKSPVSSFRGWVDDQIEVLEELFPLASYLVKDEEGKRKEKGVLVYFWEEVFETFMILKKNKKFDEPDFVETCLEGMNEMSLDFSGFALGRWAGGWIDFAQKFAGQFAYKKGDPKLKKYLENYHREESFFFCVGCDPETYVTGYFSSPWEGGSYTFVPAIGASFPSYSLRDSLDTLMQDRLACWKALEEQKERAVIDNFVKTVKLKDTMTLDSSLYSSLGLSSFLISLFQFYLTDGKLSASLGFLHTFMSSLEKEKEAALLDLLGVTKGQLFAIFDSVLKALSVYGSVGDGQELFISKLSGILDDEVLLDASVWSAVINIVTMLYEGEHMQGLMGQMSPYRKEGEETGKANEDISLVSPLTRFVFSFLFVSGASSSDINKDVLFPFMQLAGHKKYGFFDDRFVGFFDAVDFPVANDSVGRLPPKDKLLNPVMREKMNELMRPSLRIVHDILCLQKKMIAFFSTWSEKKLKFDTNDSTYLSDGEKLYRELMELFSLYGVRLWVLFRHAQTNWDRQRAALVDSPLTPTALDGFVELFLRKFSFVDPDVLLSGLLPRVRETADLSFDEKELESCVFSSLLNNLSKKGDVTKKKLLSVLSQLGAGQTAFLCSHSHTLRLIAVYFGLSLKSFKKKHPSLQVSTSLDYGKSFSFLSYAKGDEGELETGISEKKSENNPDAIKAEMSKYRSIVFHTDFYEKHIAVFVQTLIGNLESGSFSSAIGFSSEMKSYLLLLCREISLSSPVSVISFLQTLLRCASLHDTPFMLDYLKEKSEKFVRGDPYGFGLAVIDVALALFEKELKKRKD